MPHFYDDITLNNQRILAILEGSLDGNALIDESVGTDQIAANAIIAGKIAAGAITTEKLAAGSITANEIAAGTITTGLLAAGAVTAEKIAANTITAGEIAANAITASEVQANAITTAKLDALAVTADKIAAGAITSGKIAAGAVTTGSIASGSVTASEISVSSLSALSANLGSITSGTVTGALLRTGSSGSRMEMSSSGLIGYNSVGGVIFDFDTGDGSLTIAGQLTANAGSIIPATTVTGQLTDSQLAAIAAAKVTGQITTTQITDNAITTAKIAAATILASDIASHTITAAEIAAGTITSTEIAADTITAGNIAANAITTTEIAANTIVAGDIAAATITGTQIAADTIAAGNIAADAVTATEIDVATLSAISADMGTVTAGTITGATIRTSSSNPKIQLNSTSFSLTNASAVEVLTLNSDGFSILEGSGASKTDITPDRQIIWETSGGTARSAIRGWKSSGSDEALLDLEAKAAASNLGKVGLLATTNDLYKAEIVVASGITTDDDALVRIFAGGLSPILLEGDGSSDWIFKGTSGPQTITYGTTFPSGGTLRDGDIHMYPFSTDIVWQFRYNSSGGTYKWKFIGGPPAHAEVATDQALTSGTTYQALATAGPSITIPLAGDYDVSIECVPYSLVAASTTLYMSYDIGGTGAVDADAVRAFHSSGATPAPSISSQRRKTIASASTALVSKYKMDTDVDAHWLNRKMFATPVAVSG